MATITGTIERGDTVRPKIPINFKYQSSPSVASGMGVYSPDVDIVTDGFGEFSTPLVMGTWLMTVGNKDQYLISVPDNTNTYDFTSLITGFVTQSPVRPLYGLGYTIAQNTAQLRTHDTKATSNSGALLWSPDIPGYQFYRWSETSTAADDGLTVVKPSVLDVGDPGRWLWVDAGTTGGVGLAQSLYVDDMAALTAIPDAVVKMFRLVIDGPHPVWYYVHGASAGDVDSVNVFRGNDNLGNWYARVMI